MPVTVLLFASYADALGRNSIELELGAGTTTVEALLAQLASRAAGQIPPRPMVAVNQRYAQLSDVIRAGDEVAIIPPVAGG